MLSKFIKSDGSSTNLNQFIKPQSMSQVSNNNRESEMKIGTKIMNNNNSTGGNKKFDNLLKEITFSNNQENNYVKNKSNLTPLNQSSNSIVMTDDQKNYKYNDTKENTGRENFMNMVNNRPARSFLFNESDKRNPSEDK